MHSSSRVRNREGLLPFDAFHAFPAKRRKVWGQCRPRSSLSLLLLSDPPPGHGQFLQITVLIPSSPPAMNTAATARLSALSTFHLFLLRCLQEFNDAWNGLRVGLLLGGAGFGFSGCCAGADERRAGKYLAMTD